jgi:hypothetical protein
VPPQTLQKAERSGYYRFVFQFRGNGRDRASALGRPALQLAHLLDEPAVLRAKPSCLTAGTHQLLGKDGHDAAKMLQAVDRLGSAGVGPDTTM